VRVVYDNIESMKKKEMTNNLLHYSEGVLSSLTDAALFCTFYGLEVAFCGSRSSSAVWKAARNANQDLEEFNYKSIRRSFYYLKRKGLVETVKEKSYYIPKITAAGKKKLESTFAVYDEKRVWDGKFYIVTYDVPTYQNADRDILRNYLKKLGAGPLQDSTYLTPYNIRETIRNFVEERDLSGQVLISELDRNGSIGDESFEEVIERVYELRELNSRYQEFIKDNKNKKGRSRLKIAFQFTSILQDDPQLPFEILPNWWVGDRAYRLFKSVVRRIDEVMIEGLEKLDL